MGKYLESKKIEEKNIEREAIRHLTSVIKLIDRQYLRIFDRYYTVLDTMISNNEAAGGNYEIPWHFVDDMRRYTNDLNRLQVKIAGTGSILRYAKDHDYLTERHLKVSEKHKSYIDSREPIDQIFMAESVEYIAPPKKMCDVHLPYITPAYTAATSHIEEMTSLQVVDIVLSMCRDIVSTMNRCMYFTPDKDGRYNINMATYKIEDLYGRSKMLSSWIIKEEQYKVLREPNKELQRVSRSFSSISNAITDIKRSANKGVILGGVRL